MGWGTRRERERTERIFGRRECERERERVRVRVRVRLCALVDGYDDDMHARAHVCTPEPGGWSPKSHITYV